MGVWLPLALADLLASMFALVRMWASNPGEVKPPKRSEVLASWMLPMLSSSIKAGEDESAALSLFESVKRLAEKKESGVRSQESVVSRQSLVASD